MSFNLIKDSRGYKQDGDGPWQAPPFPGTRLGPNSTVRDGEPPYQSTTKQNNRRTNASLPYARRSSASKEDVWERKPRHGELVFTHGRLQSGSHSLFSGFTNALANVYTLDYVNEQIKQPQRIDVVQVDKNAPPFQPHYIGHPNTPSEDNRDVEEGDIGVWLPDAVKYWQIDGVCNVVDQLGGDDDVTNVTIQGPSSLLNCTEHGPERGQVCCSRGDLPLSRLYVGLRATKNTTTVPAQYTFKFELFSSGNVRRNEVALDNFGPPSNSKLVKVWQYGRLIDSRHVEDKDEKRIMANIFVQPPMVYRPRQPTDTPRMGSIYRGSHLSPPNGLLWRRVDSVPDKYTEYTPTTSIGVSKETELKTLIGGVPQTNGLITLNKAAWNALNILHDNEGNTKLLYNMYLKIDAKYYVPTPSSTIGKRDGAFELPHLRHGRDKDPWGPGENTKGLREMDNALGIVPTFTHEGATYTYPTAPPSPSPVGVIDEVTFGRRPGWDAATVEEQLKRREVQHIHLANQADYLFDVL
jgi:hypothetical protein